MALQSNLVLATLTKVVGALDYMVGCVIWSCELFPLVV